MRISYNTIFQTEFFYSNSACQGGSLNIMPSPLVPRGGTKSKVEFVNNSATDVGELFILKCSQSHPPCSLLLSCNFF